MTVGGALHSEGSLVPVRAHEAGMESVSRIEVQQKHGHGRMVSSMTRSGWG
jgi:hypothetical protein